MRVISSKDARLRLTEMLNEASFRGGRFLITRNGRPSAVLIGYEEFDKLTGGKLAEPLGVQVDEFSIAEKEQRGDGARDEASTRAVRGR